jgi:hypothetical protein
MIVTSEITLSSQIDSVAFSPCGDCAVVAFGRDHLAIFEVSRGSLEARSTFTLPPDRYQGLPGAQIAVSETRVSFLDERTILVARLVSRRAEDGSIPQEQLSRTTLLAVDASSGLPCGEFDVEDGMAIGVDPLPIAPHHVLLSLVAKTLICIDTSSWREVCRVRELDGVLDPVGDLAEDPEEKLTRNGVAYDRRQGLLYVLWRYFNAAALQTYTFEQKRSRFVCIDRAPTIHGEDAGYDAEGLCLKPDGSGAAACFGIDDAMIDLRGSESQAVPRMARIGRLVLFSGADRRIIDVESETARDFLVNRHVTFEPDGREVFVGYRYGTGFSEARPVYLDDQTVLLSTPSGLMLGVDTDGDRTEVLHDRGSRILALDFQRENRLLLVGSADKTACLLRT